MLKPVIVTDVPRVPIANVDRLAEFGVATVHEALGRIGFLGPGHRPIFDGARIGGCAVTALCWPGDNLMIHAAVEQCQPGDVLVVATSSPSTDGMFGELLATSLMARGVRGLVIDAGVRDIADLRRIEFPVWSAAISAQGTVKSTAGAVNVPVVIGGQTINAGDVILADDDGVMCVPAADVTRGIELSATRLAKEDEARKALQAGELGLDRYALRAKLEALGVRYQSYASYTDGAR